MIQTLRISNYAIIDEVEISLDRGLNIITGETGAGKSILLGALGLIMGERADTGVLFDNTQKCIVEAEFVDYPQIIHSILEAADYDIYDTLIIRREIVPSGKSRAFVNDTPARLDLLHKLNAVLIDLNEQFEITQIRESDYQLAIIDALAGNSAHLSRYQSIYKEYLQTRKELEGIQHGSATELKEMEFLKFQFEELEAALIEEGEQEELEAELDVLSRVDEIRSVLEETRFNLEEHEINIRDMVADLARKWEENGSSHEKIGQGAEKLNEALALLEDVYGLAGTIENTIDADPQRLREIESRLDILFSLQRKHGVNSTNELIDVRQTLGARLESYTNRDETIARLENEVDALRQKVLSEAETISSRRQKVFANLEKEVNAFLTALAMDSAEISVSHGTGEPGPLGIDNIELLFKSNKGARFQPVRKIASGGESSRLMLAIKSIVADVMELPTMIFDEIDTGVSGEVAARMGNILRDLAGSHQLICITHSPQVSSRAHHHYLVYKKEGQDRSFTRVKLLDRDERVTEIAKMLSGDPPSTFALDNAKDLLSKQEN